MNNQNFKNLLTKYIEFFYRYKSISLLKKANDESQFDIKLRLVLTQKFLLHSLGLQYNKKLFRKYKNNNFELYRDIKNDQLNYDELIKDISKNKKDLIDKKLKALEIFVDIIKNINQEKLFTFAFEFFKLKPKFDIDGAYNHSQLILVTKSNEENQRCIIYGILGDLYTTNSKDNSHFLNENKNLMNTVFIPISIKIKNNENLLSSQNIQKIDIAFLNKRRIQEKEIRV